MTDWFLRPINPDPAEAWCFQVVPTGPINIYYNYTPYYERLAQLISQTDGNGDEVFLAGWEFRMNVPMKDKKSLLEWLQSSRDRKTRVRLLASGNNGNEADVAIAAKGNAEGHGKLEALIDNQLDSGRPHHQKAGFFRLKSSSHLFVGGMDISEGRRGRWFDVQAEVMGPAADLGRITLEERWESVTGRRPGNRSTVIPRGGNAQHQVQFIRTYPPVGKNPPASTRNFAPNGEHTYYELLKKAIGLAKKSIYIEDQFFWTMGSVPPKTARSSSDPARRSDISEFPALLEDLLVQAVNRGVKLIVIGPNFDHPDNKDFKDYRIEVVETLKKAKTSAANAPVLLKTHPDILFIHSKTWIFDDEFVVIGSANHWEKSFVSIRDPAESEFGIAFTSAVDGKPLGIEGATFGRALRLKLWERLRFSLDPNHRFPFSASATLNEEITELRSLNPSGEEPFSDMP